MTSLRQAAQQALEALEERYVGALRDRAIEALEAALAEPEQEPVGWQWLNTCNYRKKLPANAIPEHWRPLYTAAPTPRKPQPLTEDEIADLWDGQLFHITDLKLATDFVRDIERAHGIGEQQ